jgi:hypothetical protein
VAFTLTYVVAFLTYGLAIEADLAVSYTVIVLALGLVLMRVQHTVQMPAWVLWLMTAWGFGHMAGGIVPASHDRTLYNVVLLPFDLLKYDQMIHAIGFGTATVICGFVMLRWLPQHRFTVGQAFFVVLAGLGIGAINEIVEFAFTKTLPDTNVGGYENTSWDLVADVTGGLVAAAWFLWRQRRTSEP